MYNILQNINKPANIKELNNEQLNTLATEIRHAILNIERI